jgi:hypothetical protein
MRDRTYLLTVMALASGCTSAGINPGHECTTQLAIPITGSVNDKNGHPIIPDRV